MRDVPYLNMYEANLSQENVHNEGKKPSLQTVIHLSQYHNS